MSFQVKNFVMAKTVWHGALSWWNIYLSAMYSLTRMTLFLSFSKTFWLIIRSRGINSLRIIPLMSRKQISIDLIFFRFAHLSLLRSKRFCCMPHFTLSQDHIQKWFITWLKKFYPLTILSRRSRHVFFRMYFSWVVRLFVTILVQTIRVCKISIKIWWTAN